ncbi:malonyl CoA-ACP transacylase [Mycolicibacterium cyprinidarum]|uniref:Malonyl CoA-ACP transacylase n=1 Tax=Mycolicibacterium cyprinidarum TaxID=2860311 RepID=A0ABQ4V4N7_9MYCO|nr:malonyl CoA-ACP transacylase [Mycolicibacterium sp. NGTWSNA01]GJF12629.1 malonyl CoA-ACP transacylase [Mycolicibacterium sp. NGTWS0302]
MAATVGNGCVTVAEVDARESALREGVSSHALPRSGTGEARQLRRWIAQVLVAERVVTAEARALGACEEDAPSEWELLPDEVARLEIGSVAAATLSEPVGRAVFAHVTAAVRISAEQVRDYHRRNPLRFAMGPSVPGAWRCASAGADLDEVRPAITAHLLAAARRREYRRWLDARCAEVVVLAPGYEHPGDPRQPDNTHRH